MPEKPTAARGASITRSSFTAKLRRIAEELDAMVPNKTHARELLAYLAEWSFSAPQRYGQKAGGLGPKTKKTAKSRRDYETFREWLERK